VDLGSLGEEGIPVVLAVLVELSHSGELLVEAAQTSLADVAWVRRSLDRSLQPAVETSLHVTTLVQHRRHPLLQLIAKHARCLLGHLLDRICKPLDIDVLETRFD
jgi:hypothetical protein